MKIGIIGTGNVGATLGKKWIQSGHDVVFGVRNINQFKGKDNLTGMIVMKMQEAIHRSDVLLLAIPSAAILDWIKTAGTLEGKVIIDATNSVRSKPAPYPTAYHAIADLTKARVVKCFNSTGFENMQNPNFVDHILDMFMAGGDERSQEICQQLSQDCGFENCISFGGEDKVVLLEQFALSWINLAIMQGMGRNIGFKLISR